MTGRKQVSNTFFIPLFKAAHSRWIIIGFVLIGLTVRLPGLWANTFHTDEALFASWARLIAVWREPLLETQLVDKPPLLFYAQALFYPLMGTPAGWPARLPNLIAGILLIPLTGRLTHQLYGHQLVTLVAVMLMALSPLAIQFSASGFIDPLLTTLLVGALVLVAARPVGGTGWNRYYWAGVLFGLAVLAKYQAWLFLPLVLGVGWLFGWGRAEWGRWTAGFLPPLLLFGLWGLARQDEAAVWGSQWQNIGGLRLSHSWELGPRLAALGRLGQSISGSIVGVLILLGLPLLFWRSGREHYHDYALDNLLVLFMLAYLVLHWLVSVPVWDRYLLPLVPLLAVLAGRVVARIIVAIGNRVSDDGQKRGWISICGLILVVMLLIPGAIEARGGEWPVGARPGADSGAGAVAAWLQDAPYGTVLYDHWYSWQWRYYFFDQGVFVSWFPHPAALVEDLNVFGDGGDMRYLVLPNGEISRPVQRAVAEAGFVLEPAYMAEGMTLFQVIQP